MVAASPELALGLESDESIPEQPASLAAKAQLQTERAFKLRHCRHPPSPQIPPCRSACRHDQGHRGSTAATRPYHVRR